MHGYLAQLQVGGQVIQFLSHRGYPVPSPACLQQIGDAFRRRVASFAEANHIPVVTLKAADRNIEVMQPYLDRAAATGRSQVAAIGVAQEPSGYSIARQRPTDPGKCPQFSFDKKDRRVTVYYFYLWDARTSARRSSRSAPTSRSRSRSGSTGTSGPSGRPARPGSAFTELSNGFAACQDPAVLQEICDALQPGTIEVFFQRWLARLPLPLDAADQQAGYWWECSMRPGRGVPHHRVRPAPPRPGVLRGAGHRQPRPGPPGHRRDRLRPADHQRQAARHPGHVQDQGHHLRHRDHHQRVLQATPGSSSTSIISSLNWRVFNVQHERSHLPG